MLDSQQREMVNVYNHIFYFKNDAAHKCDHMEEVYETMVDINHKLKLNINDKLIFLTAYLHDAFEGVDRDKHEELAFYYVINIGDDYISKLSKSERKRVAVAILNHRASYKNTLNDDSLTIILRIADKGKPDLDTMLSRSLRYTISNDNSRDLNKIFEDVKFHMCDKFGRNGYAWKNKDDKYTEYYNESIDKLWDEIDNLTLDRIENIYTSSL